MTPFWYGWNSWVVELLGGFALMGLVLLAFPPFPGVGIALGISVLYERFVDINGWSWTDVGQRACGMAIPILWSLR